MLLRTFGGVRLEETEFTRPKPLLLLCYVALEGPQQRRFLTDLFWPGAHDPMKNLTVTLTRLRKGAPGAIEADDEHVWATITTDAEQFLAYLDEQQLPRALELYQGPFLQGLYLRNWSTELEEWVYHTREFLAGRACEASLQRADAAAARAHFLEAAKHAEHAYTLAGAPAPEPVTLVRMHTLMLAGGHPRVAELAEEAAAFGVSLLSSQDTARAHLQEALHDAARATTHNLPPRSVSFVGRELELSELETLLTKPTCRLITLLGPAGVGKTKLALHVAHEQLTAGSFQDGIYLAPLESLSAAELIPTVVAKELGLEPHVSRDPLQHLAARIGDKHMLLLLDNIEHLKGAAPMLLGLVQRCPQLTLLVTSRERLKLDLETVFPIAGLPFPKHDSLTADEALHFNAVTLFVQRAKRARPDFMLTPEQLPDVLHVCRLVEGLPLALELAAAWISILPAREIAAELEKNLDVLTTRTRNAAERHKSLRSAFEHSWGLLSKKEQFVLRRLSVFRGGFRREAASKVAGTTIPILAALVDKSLLHFSATGRYDRHPLLYQYIREKLLEHPQEAARTREAHGAYYIRLLQRSAAEARGGAQKAALETLEEELENIRVAWHWATSERRVEATGQALEPLAWFFKIRGRRQEGIEVLAHAVPEKEERDPAYRAVLGNVLSAQARLYQDLGRYEEAGHLARRGLALLQPFQYEPGMIRGLDTLGRVAWRSGNFAEAKIHWDNALEVAQTQGDEETAATLVGDLAMIEQELGQYDQAERHYREALSKTRKHGNRLHEIRNLNNLGELYFLTGRLEQAQALWQEGLSLAQEIAFGGLLPYFYSNLGLAAFELNDYPRAEAMHQQALRQARKSGDQSLEAATLARLSRLATAKGALSDAEHHAQQALTLSWAIQDMPDVLTAFVSHAELQLKKGHLEVATSVLSLILQHPATNQHDHAHADTLLTELRDKLSPDTLTEAFERGKTLSVEGLMADLLAEKQAHRGAL